MDNHTATATMTDDEAMLTALSAALDEIYRLRQAFAYEAQVTEAHLGYRTFPKTRREHAEQQAERMRRAARGESEATYSGRSSLGMRHAMEQAGASPSLTVHMFLAERHLPHWDESAE